MLDGCWSISRLLNRCADTERGETAERADIEVRTVACLLHRNYYDLYLMPGAQRTKTRLWPWHAWLASVVRRGEITNRMSLRLGTLPVVVRWIILAKSSL